MKATELNYLKLACLSVLKVIILAGQFPLGDLIWGKYNTVTEEIELRDTLFGLEARGQLVR